MKDKEAGGKEGWVGAARPFSIPIDVLCELHSKSCTLDIIFSDESGIITVAIRPDECYNVSSFSNIVVMRIHSRSVPCMADTRKSHP